MPSDNKEMPVILERFRLVRQLGEGGMGTVYMGEHIHLGSLHAIKALKAMVGAPPELQQQMEARFLREAKVCASVKHPNLVSVTDFGVSDGNLYLVMDFVDGEDLQALIAREGGLGESMSLQILRDVTSAVGALHAKGIIHRDLKPPNVMIERDTGRVILTDLGIAKDLEGGGGSNMTQGILGTPAYMAPEQMIDTSKTGFESDVYALGATFFAMLACRDPFQGDNPLVVLQTAREQLFTYKSLAGVAKMKCKMSISPEVNQLLDDMTQYERSKRIKSCDEVVKRISAILAKPGASAVAGTMQMADGPGAADNDMTLIDMDALSQMQAVGPASLVKSPSAAAAPPKPAAVQKKETSNALAALSGGGARRKQKTSSGGGALFALLFILAGAGGGGYYWYNFIYLPSQQAEIVKPAVVTADIPTDVEPADIEAADARQGVSDVKVAAASVEVPQPKPEPEPSFAEADAPKRLSVPLDAGTAMEFVLVPSGEFLVGSSDAANSEERPQRRIEFTRPFYLGRFETTVGQFVAYLNEAKPKDDTLNLPGLRVEFYEGAYEAFPGVENHPVRNASHEQARAFCRWLSRKAEAAAELPNEVEWEYAARGPESREYSWGNEWDDAMANAGRRDVVEVGSFPEGASWCGVMDMAGNVFEWCADKYESTRYAGLPRRDPPALDAGSSRGLRVIKGGGFGNDAYFCRTAYRNGVSGNLKDDSLGFRVKIRAEAAVLRYGVE